MEWLKRNKALIGLILGALTLFANFKCPFLPHEYCEPFTKFLGTLSSFLVGAGLIDSDTREKYVQGLIKPEEK